MAQPFQGWCGVLCWVNKGRLIFSVQRTGWRCQGSHQRWESDRPWKGQQASYMSILKYTNWCPQIETSYSLVSCEDNEHIRSLRELLRPPNLVYILVISFIVRLILQGRVRAQHDTSMLCHNREILMCREWGLIKLINMQFCMDKKWHSICFSMQRAAAAEQTNKE